ncbi:hypothetical protein JMN32_22150 [Fulvivirga sp. 29W222]|uniref:Uncharacterized protein n=1 Tax=Fulvivirga marina TaxID=2494733 RepID=A0A937KG54_9BACT|nr:hypothetical protein [Fulvivirga marina]MBL6449030.1 hypothetical protein [Fulvivirga marina]
MKIKILTVLIVVATFATTYAQKESKMPEVTITYDQKLAETNGEVELTKGKCIVFEIKKVQGGDPRVDAQVTTSLVFDIAEDAKEFEINDNSWEKKQAYVRISECRCMDRGYNPIISGTLKGKKLADNKWHIEADVVARGKDSGEDRIFKYTGVISSQK